MAAPASIITYREVRLRDGRRCRITYRDGAACRMDTRTPGVSLSWHRVPMNGPTASEAFALAMPRAQP